MKIEEALKDLCRSANISLDEIDTSQIGDIMKASIREKEQKVVAVLGEPVPTKKKGRKGEYYRYCINISKGILKEIVRKEKSAAIHEAYQVLFGDKAVLKDLTVADVFELWYEDRKNNKNSKTCLIDLSFWNNHLKDSKLAGMKLASVRAEHIEDALNEICGDHRIERSSLNAILTLLRSIWSKAISKSIVEVNLPKNMDFKDIKQNTKQPKPEVQKQEEVFRDDEIDKLRNELWKRDRDIYDQAILFLCYIGIRIGEMRAICWGDYDETSGELSLNHEIVKRKIDSKNYVDVDVPHTKGYAALGQRKFLLPTPCITILEEMRAINGDKHYVFQSSGQYPINPNHLNARLKELCNKLGIRYFSSHKFRFYWISSAYKLGMDETIIQLIAGHASPEMTRHYNRSTKKLETFSQNEMDLISGYNRLETPENSGF